MISGWTGSKWKFTKVAAIEKEFLYQCINHYPIPMQPATNFEIMQIFWCPDNSMIWLQVEQRMATEEATCQLQNAEHSENK